MPTYEFHCPKCNENVTLTLRLKEYEEKSYSCPKCGEKNLKQVVTHFLTKTSKKS